MVHQQMPGAATGQGQPMNNQNMNAANPTLRPTFVLQPESVASARATENLRSRSADSRPLNSTAPASNIEDDEADWVDVPMDMPMPMPMPMPAQAVPNLPMYPTPRFRGPAIIRKFESLKSSSFFTSNSLVSRIDRSESALHIAIFHSDSSSTFR